MPPPLRVGLVGAGPWAHRAHAPMLASSPDIELVGIWGRRPEVAAALAARHGTAAFETIDALFDACDAVAFAVPPDVQCDLAARAARAGKALLLEKPLGTTIAEARKLVEVVLESGVASMMVLTWRYGSVVREFIAEAAGREWFGGRGCFVSGGLLPESPYATPWRREHGPLLDLGPHVVDLLDASLGTVVDVRSASGQRLGLVNLVLSHESGATSVATVCGTCPIDPSVSGAELFGPEGSLALDCQNVKADAFGTVAADFTEAARRGSSPLDVRHGLRLQELIERASALLDG